MKTNYKQTEIGEIPENWETGYLSSVAKVNEKVINRDYLNNIIEYIDVSSTMEGQVIETQKLTLENAPSRAKRIIRDEDILISTVRPNLRHFAFINKTKPNLIGSTGYAVITAKGINPRFLYYYLTTNDYTNYLSAIADTTTSTYPAFTPDILESSLLPIPPIEEQRQIASILSSLDDKIELNRKMNKTLEEIGKALFKRWFVDFEFPNENGEPYKSSGSEMLDSELGNIPIGWEVKTLRQLVEYYVGGGWGSEQRDENYTIEAMVVRGTDIPEIKTGSYSSLPIRFHKESNYKSRFLEEGDIVFEVSGGSTDQPVGRSCLILRGLLNQYNNKPICASFCKLIRPVRDLGYLLQPAFEILYSTDEIYKYQEKSTGITNYKFEFFLDEYKLSLPLGTSLITQYISFSRSLNNRISALSVESEYLKKIRDSLLPRLMSGKLRVKN